MGIAKVAESMQLCAYNLTINYYMVKLTNHKKTIDRPLGCKRWGIIAIIIIIFAGSLSFLLYSYFSHDADNPQCNCLLCMLNHVPEEGEYIYNRYLIFISFIWIAVIFAAIFLVNYCFVKKNHEYGKRTKRNSVRLSTYLLLFLITQYSYLGIARLFNSLYFCANKI